MPLRWRETFPDDKNPDDIVGGLGYHAFARIEKAIDGVDAGRYRWYLNGIPTNPGVQILGVEDTLDQAKAEVEKNFQAWLVRAGLQER